MREYLDQFGSTGFVLCDLALALCVVFSISLYSPHLNVCAVYQKVCAWWTTPLAIPWRIGMYFMGNIAPSQPFIDNLFPPRINNVPIATFTFSAKALTMYLQSCFSYTSKDDGSSGFILARQFLRRSAFTVCLAYLIVRKIATIGRVLLTTRTLRIVWLRLRRAGLRFCNDNARAFQPIRDTFFGHSIAFCQDGGICLNKIGIYKLLIKHIGMMIEFWTPSAFFGSTRHSAKTTLVRRNPQPICLHIKRFAAVLTDAFNWLLPHYNTSYVVFYHDKEKV